MAAADKVSISLEEHVSARGSLYVGEVAKQIPFDIKRFFVIRDVPAGSPRGEHAHKTAEQAIFCLQGSCEVVCDDGKTKQAHRLDEISHGVLLSPKVWHVMRDLSKNCILLVVSSELHDEDEYIRDYQEFLKCIQ